MQKNILNKDSIELLKEILIHRAGKNWLDRISSMQIEELEDLELLCISKRNGYLKRVAFFCPTPGLDGNFGELPFHLEAKGCEVLWLYGGVEAYLNSDNSNKWLVIRNMAEKLKGIDAIITANVMDCLPKNVLRILHDHLSFAHFDTENTLYRLINTPILHNKKYLSKHEIFHEFSAFLVFLPFYDLILTSSLPITRMTVEALKFSGFTDNTYSSKNEIRNTLPFSSFSHLVDIQDYRNNIYIKQTGYCKLDIPINKYNNQLPEKIIVFAPTPNDKSGNKGSELWLNAMTVNDYAVDLLKLLCSELQDYKIVFKPYLDELDHVISNIQDELSCYNNFEIDFCGSNYWELYSRAQVLISDFSSTAYSFALGVGKPVVFFSPNENQLSDELKNNSYCSYRESIGLVALDIEDVLISVKKIILDYSFFTANSSAFQIQNLKNPGKSGYIAAQTIFSALNNDDTDDNFDFRLIKY